MSLVVEGEEEEEEEGGGGGLATPPQLLLHPSRFLRDFRDAAIIRFAVEKLGPKGGALIEGLLSGAPAELKASMSRRMSVHELLRTEAARRIDCDGELAESLLTSFLLQDAPCFVTVVDARHVHDETSYVVNLDGMVQSLKLRTAIASINSKYGKHCGRIVRLLLEKKQLEEKHVGELLMIPGKEVRGHLYKLLQARVLHLQEMSAKPDLNPQNTFYLWSVIPPLVIDEMCEMACHAILNLRIRARVPLPDPAAAAVVAERTAVGVVQLEEMLSAMWHF